MRRAKILDFLLILLFWFAPTQAMVSAIIGGAVRQRDIFGQLVWVENGNASTYVEYFFLAMVSVLLFTLALSKLFHKTFAEKEPTRGLFIAVILLVAVSTIFNLQSWNISDLARTVLFFSVGVSFIGHVISERTLTLMRFSAIALLVLIGVFASLRPDYAFNECRDDKCSPFGSLMNSFLPHENYLALVMLACLPLLLGVVRTWLRNTSVAVCLVYILASGSRVAYLAVGVYSLLVVARKTKWAIALPPVTVVFSLIILFSLTGNDVTGRGTIYQFIRERLQTGWVLGSGPNTLIDAYQSGQIAFLAYHEHGFAPYLLDRYGAIVFLAVFSYFLAVAVKLWKNPLVLTKLERWLPMSMISLSFASETPLQFTISGPFVWVLALYVSSEVMAHPTPTAH